MSEALHLATTFRNMRQFYLAFPIRDALRRELSWSHYRRIMRVDGNALLAAEYLTRLPSEEDLVRVVERNHREFEARHEAHLLEESDS